jgi:hypothetical protein
MDAHHFRGSRRRIKSLAAPIERQYTLPRNG